MATGDDIAEQLLAAATPTPIAQLSPELPDPPSRVVRGEVTITWPYNSVNRSLAFLLAEPDVRLRRVKGQVRVQLSGSSARAAAECRIGGGDEITLSLDGIEWEKDGSSLRLPGSRVEWQLKFSERVLLKIKSEESQITKIINVDHPAPAPVEEEASHTPEIISEVPPIPLPQTTQRSLLDRDYPEEYSSPAFMKRARISYGSLFEGGFDIFEEDGAVKGKGRKRTRFGRASNAWRYSSQSPSPEPEQESEVDVGVQASTSPIPSSPRPQMADEGCQTMEVDMSTEVPEPVSEPGPARAEPSETAEARPAEAQSTAAPLELSDVRPEVEDATPPSPLREAPSDREPQVSQEQPRTFIPERSPEIIAETSQEMQSERPQKPQETQETQETQQTQEIQQTQDTQETQEPLEVQETPASQEPQGFQQAPEAEMFASPPASGGLPFGSSLFGTFAPSSEAYGVSPFSPNADASAFSGHGLSLGDRVRFGFAHSQAAFEAPHHDVPPTEQQDSLAHEHYPEALLEHSATSNGNHSAAHSPHPGSYGFEPAHGMSAPDTNGNTGTEPLTVWPITSEGLEAEHAEGQAPVAVTDYELPGVEGDVRPEEAVDKTGVPREVDNYGGYIESRYKNEEEEQMVAMDETRKPKYSPEEEDEDAEAEFEADEIDQPGDDYDLRNYDNDIEDDEDGYEQYEDDGAVVFDREDGERSYDEDDEEEESEDEDEVDYESESEEEQQPQRPPQQNAQPVVIDLISDSDEEEEEEDAAEGEDGAEEGEGEEDEEDEELEAMEKMAEEVKASQAPLGRMPVPPSQRTHHARSSPPMESHQHRASSQERGQPSPPGHYADVAQEKPATKDDSEEVSATEDISAEKQNTPHVASESVAPTTDTDADQASGKPQLNGAEPRDEGGSPSYEVRLSESDEDEEEEEAEDSSEEYASEGDGEGSESSDDQEPQDSVAVEPTDGVEQQDVGEVEMADYDESAPSPQQHGTASNEERSPAAESPGSPTEEVVIATQVTVVEVVESQLPENDTAPDADGDTSMDEAPEEEIEPEQSRRYAPGGDGDEIMGEAEACVSELEQSSLLLPAESLAGELSEVSFEHFQENLRTEKTRGKQALPSSPPATQSFESQISVEKHLIFMSSPPASQVAQESGAEEQLPTPRDTQPMDALVFQEAPPDAADDNLDAASQVSERHPSSDLCPIPEETRPIPAEDEEDSDDSEYALAQQLESEGAEQASKLRAVRAEDQVDQKAQDGRPDETLEPTPPPASPAEDTAAGEDQSQPGEVDHEAMEVDRDSTDAGGEAPTSPVTEQENEGSGSIVSAKATKDLPKTRPKSHSISKRTPTKARGDLDPSILLARASKKSLQQPRGKGRMSYSPPASTKLKATPPKPRARSVRGSASPATADVSVLLAKAPLRSVSPRSSDTQESMTLVKLELGRRLQSELPECIILSNLKLHLRQKLDVAAIAAADSPQPQRTKTRQFSLFFTVVDHTVAPGHVVEVRLFRAHKDSLPSFRAGDGILLRGFEVVALAEKEFGLKSVEDSSYAVFGGGDDGEDEEQEPQINGPPMEDIEHEAGYLGVLKQWYGLLDEASREGLARVSERFTQAAKV